MNTTIKRQEGRADSVGRTAKLFKNGNSQAVRLPEEFRFSGDKVYIRRDPRTGDVILSSKPKDWSIFLMALEEVPLSEKEGFLEDLARDQLPAPDKDIFEGWEE